MLLNLSYKGDRNYLHGTDIFNFLDSYFRSCGGFLISLSFRSFAQKQLEITLEKPKLADALPLAEGLVKYPWGESQFWLTESDQDVDMRYSFDETLITNMSIITSYNISLASPNQFSLIENLVSLTKHISNVKSPLDVGKWIFGKIKLNQALPCKWQSIYISRLACLKGRLIRYNIHVDNVDIGEIVFIVSPL